MKNLLKYFGMFYFSNWNLQNSLIIRQMFAEAVKVLLCMPASKKPSHGIQKEEVRRDVRVLEACCQDCNDQALFQRCPIHEDKCPIQGAIQDQNSTCVIMYIVQPQDEGDGLILCSSVDLMSDLSFVTIKTFLCSSLGFNLIEIC
jgi:hypothetical protein